METEEKMSTTAAALSGENFSSLKRIIRMNVTGPATGLVIWMKTTPRYSYGTDVP
jgi:hypothetical protein